MDEDTEMGGGELLTRINTVFSGDKCVGETSGNGAKLDATKKRDLDSSATKWKTLSRLEGLECSYNPRAHSREKWEKRPRRSL